MTIRITKKELAKMLAPLTVLPGGDRLNAAALDGYWAVFSSYYPHEMKKAIKSCFVSCEFFPTPKQIMTRLMDHRRTMGNKRLDMLEAEHQKLMIESGATAQISGPNQAIAPAQATVRSQGQLRQGVHAVQGDGPQPAEVPRRDQAGGH